MIAASLDRGAPMGRSFIYGRSVRMIRAVADIGTNSVKMIVGMLEHDQAKVLSDDVVITKLGDELEQTGRISEAAARRTSEAIARLAEKARSNGAEDIWAIGTECLRRAENAADICKMISASAGIEIDVISGEREAALTRSVSVGLLERHINDGDPVCLFDLGGGSCEISIIERDRPIASASLRFGALTLAKKFFAASGPEADMDISLSRANAEIRELVTGAFPHPTACGGCAASGGTIASLCSLKQKRRPSGADELHGAMLTRDDIERLITELCSTPRDLVAMLPGMTPGREDTIIPGACAAAAIMDIFQVTELRVSTRGLRYAALREMLFGC